MALPSLRDNLHPGPKDSSLLTHQHNHISSNIWFGQDRVLRARLNYIRGPKPHESILAMLKIAGFGYVARIENFNIDISLISALVERWRPETRTFHFPNGECTITLEDVALQLGIPIDGDAVMGIGTTNVDWRALCKELLGAVPPKHTWDGQTVELSWLATKFEKLPNDASKIVVQQYTRAYIMKLIGGLLMPDRLGTRVDLMHLPLLRDLSRVANFSWGSAMLACLYRELCHASKMNSIDIGGCLVLLQAWAWDRIPSIAPQIDRLSEDQVSRGFGFPLARRWSYCLKPMESVRYYRFALDQLDIHQFIWTPYASPDVRRLITQDPGEICYAMVPLICFGIIEWHYPDRVMRQFGLRQPIPQPPVNMDSLQEVDKNGRGAPEECRTWISLWMLRRERIIQGRPFHGYLDEISHYMTWYFNVTRRWISPEGAFVGTMVMGVRNILGLAKSETPTPTGMNIVQTCNDMLNVSQQYYLSIKQKNLVSPIPPKVNFKPNDKKDVPYKPPAPAPPLGFASYSQSNKPFAYNHQRKPMGFASYPSPSHNVPKAAYPPHSMGAPHPMITANPGTASSAFAGRTYPHMVDPKSAPSYRTPVMPPYSETEDEDESEFDSDFGSDNVTL